jgi:hypothetical protein
MASKSTAEVEQTPAVETDALDETRVGSFAGWGATVAVFHGDLLSHLEYPPAPTTRRYEVDPGSGLITRRLA